MSIRWDDPEPVEAPPRPEKQKGFAELMASARQSIRIAEKAASVPKAAPKTAPRAQPAAAAQARANEKPAAVAKRKRTRRDDIGIAALGVTLGLICAMFPWYIFFNPEQFGIRAMRFEGNGDVVDSGPITLTPKSDRVGAPVAAEEIPDVDLDLFATGTALKHEEEEAATEEAPGLKEQPFPVIEPQFKLVHIANGRAMLEDEAGYFVVQTGDMLPDNTEVRAIEEREGKWGLVTTGERVLEMTN